MDFASWFHRISNPFPVSQANRGKPLEDVISRSAEAYHRLHLALCVRQHPGAVIAYWPGTKKPKVAYYEEKGFLDWLVQTPGMPPIAFDAKTTRNLTHFPLKNIKPHQGAAAHEWEAMGGLAFFLIEFEDGAPNPERYLVPWRIVWEHITSKASSIPRSVIERHCRTIPANNVFGIECDFLAVLDDRAA